MVTWHGVPPRSQSSASSARRSSPASADDQADGEDAGCSEEKALRDAGETAEQAEAELVLVPASRIPPTAGTGAPSGCAPIFSWSMLSLRRDSAVPGTGTWKTI